MTTALLISDIHPNQRLERDADHCHRSKPKASTHESISCGKCFKEHRQKYGTSVQSICTVKIQIKINFKSVFCISIHYIVHSGNKSIFVLCIGTALNTCKICP